MTTIGDNSNPVGIAAGQLRSLVERIESIEAEIKERNRDKSGVYQEAKGAGYDLKALREIVRIRRQSPDERQEHETIVDLYRSALGMVA